MIHIGLCLDCDYNKHIYKIDRLNKQRRAWEKKKKKKKNNELCYPLCN